MEALLEPYNLQPQEIEQLDGYASLNYRVKSNGQNHLIKHYLEATEYDLICEEDRILGILATKAFSFLLPASQRALQVYQDGSFSRLLPFIEGQLLSSVEQTDALLVDFGAAIAKLNQQLLLINSDTVKARVLFWDMKHTLLNADKMAFIQNATDRKVVAYYLDLFQQDVLPIQNQLRHSIIHSDLNDNNIIVEGETVKGIIDFGDIAYSPLIYEVAIAITYIMLGNEEDPFEKAKAFLQGYHKVLPLKQEEIELLYILIPARLCVSVCNSAQKKAEGTDTEYVLVSEKPAWQLLHKWIALNPLYKKNFFLQAVGLSSEPLIDTDILISKRERLTGKSLGTSYSTPIHMTGAAFQYMYDNLGHTYLDAYNNVPHVGHCHPRISKVVSNKVRKLNTNTRYLYPELVDYAEALTEKLPDTLHKVFYVNSGSAAADVAIRMAQTHTKRKKIAILENGYHGNTQLGIAISDYKHNGKGGSGKSENIITLPLPKFFNGKFNTGKAYADDAKHILQAAIDQGHTPAAFVVEPISGCGGQVPLAEGYLECLKPFLDKHQILLVVDEVQTGFGRLGKCFWGFELYGVVPDILILGKPMGNGHPVAGLVTTPELAESFANGMEFFSSFAGNPVSCAVALEVLKIIDEEDLSRNAELVGACLKKGLVRLQARYDCIVDVRGEGLFLGVEYKNKLIASRVKENLKHRFILVGTDGPLNNVIKIKPPLCFNLTNADQLVRAIEEAIEQATMEHESL